MWPKICDLLHQALQDIPKYCYGKFYCLREYCFIQTIIEHHEWHPMQILRAMERFLGKKVFCDIIEELRRHKLNHIESRLYWVQNITKMTQNLMLLCNSELLQQSLLDPHSLYEEIKDILWKTINPINAKGILVVLEQRLPEERKEKQYLRTILQKADISFAQRTLNKILDAIGQERNLLIRPSVQETIKNTSALIAQALSPEQQPKDETSASMQNLAILQQQNENYHTALEIAHQQLETLESEIEIIRSEAKREATLLFFQRMNAPSFGNLLDQIAMSEERLKDMKRLNYTFPSEVESIPMSIRMFMKFARSCDIEAIQPLGQILTINLKESDQYEYEGSEFKDEIEQKEVLVLTSGWQYQGHIISKPKVIEIKKTTAASCMTANDPLN